jgi:O-antigen/teichoic acid export membrane protein
MLVAAVLGFALLPIKARYLSTSEFGIVATGTALVTVIVIFANGGLTAAVSRFYFDYPDHGRDWRRFLGTAILLNIAITGLVVAVLAALAPVLEPLLPSGFSLLPYGALVLGIVLLTPTFQVVQGLRAAERRAVSQSLSATGIATLAAGLTALLIILGLGAAGALTGQLIAAAVFFAASLWALLRRSGIHWRWGAAQQALAYSLPFVPHTLTAWITSLSDRLILGKMASLSEVGVYTMGYTIASVVGMAAQAVNLSNSPVFMSKARQDPDASIPLFVELNTTMFGVVVIFGVLVSAFASELVSLLATTQYSGAVSVIPVVAIGMVFQGLYFTASNPIVFTKSAVKYLPLTSAAGAIVNVTLNLLLIPRLGFMGSAWATVAGYGVWFIAARYLANRCIHVPFAYRAMLAIGLSAVPLIAISLAEHAGAIDGGVALVAKAVAAVGFCAYVVLTRLSGLRRVMG